MRVLRLSCGMQNGAKNEIRPCRFSQRIDIQADGGKLGPILCLFLLKTDVLLTLPDGSSLPNCPRQHLSLGEPSGLRLDERTGRAASFQ